MGGVVSDRPDPEMLANLDLLENFEVLEDPASWENLEAWDELSNQESDDEP